MEKTEEKKGDNCCCYKKDSWSRIFLIPILCLLLGFFIGKTFGFRQAMCYLSCSNDKKACQIKKGKNTYNLPSKKEEK